MRKKQGYELGTGPYSKVSDGKDKIRQNKNSGDLPAGAGSYELNYNKLAAISENRGGLSRKGTRNG